MTEPNYRVRLEGGGVCAICEKPLGVNETCADGATHPACRRPLWCECDVAYGMAPFELTRAQYAAMTAPRDGGQCGLCGGTRNKGEHHE